VTKTVDVCDKSEDLGYATLLFKQVKESNEYLYKAMIRAYAHNEVYKGDTKTKAVHHTFNFFYLKLIFFIVLICLY
jgi:hypothetical protein